jgi:flagellar biogenesis protein FliO
MNEAALALRCFAACAVVALVLSGLAFVLRSIRMRTPVLGGRSLRVLESAQLSATSALHLVRAGDVRLLVGSGPGSVSLLCTLGEEAKRERETSRGPDAQAA